jgi:hypothetical protein
MCFGVAIEGFRRSPTLKKWTESEKQIAHPHPPKAGGWVRDDKMRSRECGGCKALHVVRVSRGLRPPPPEDVE